MRLCKEDSQVRFGKAATDWRFMSTRLMVTLIAVLPLVGRAEPPGWWYSRGVIDANKPANDFAAANQGQVKFIATQAVAEMDAYLPGGAGASLHQLVGAWDTPGAATNDFAPVNAGQLKTLAKPFYEQLIRVGYATAYPWSSTSTTTTANDYAAVNVGQVKNLFAFDLSSTDAVHDANGNGLPDWWEHFYGVPASATATGTLPWDPTLTYLQAFQGGFNPVDFFNGQAPDLAVVGGNEQHGAPGEWVSLPLAVQVSLGGQPLANAPVRFTVTQGGGQLQRSNASQAGSTLTVLTNGNGQAQVFFRLSANAQDSNEVEARPATGNYLSKLFKEHADGTAGTNPSPFAPTNFVSQGNPDGSVDMSWENHTDDQTRVEIEMKQADGTWKRIANLAPGTTSYRYEPAP